MMLSVEYTKPYEFSRMSMRSCSDTRQRIEATLRDARNVILMGVGDGNDAVSLTWLYRQLQNDFPSFKPDKWLITTMLPDIARYKNVEERDEHPLLQTIMPQTLRTVGRSTPKEMPESILAGAREQFGFQRIVGLSLKYGTKGVLEALAQLTGKEEIDTIIACDVGGDFIADSRNVRVLSPMMDAFALEALQRFTITSPGIRLIGGIVGLGTDAESSPHNLEFAMEGIERKYIGTMDREVIADTAGFYREKVRPIRISRTGDYTLHAIETSMEDAAIKLPGRVRFCVPDNSSPTGVHVEYANFQEDLNLGLARRYILFDDLNGVTNRYKIQSPNPLDWFLAIQANASSYTGRACFNTELNGQTITGINHLIDGLDQSGKEISIFLGTASWAFTDDPTRAILINKCAAAIHQGHFTCALVLSRDLERCNLRDLNVRRGLVSADYALLYTDPICESVATALMKQMCYTLNNSRK